MMISKLGKTQKVKIDCPFCGAALEIDKRDIEVDTMGKHIICGNCRNPITIKTKILRMIGWS